MEKVVKATLPFYLCNDHHTASGYFRTGNQYVYSKLIKIMNLTKNGVLLHPVLLNQGDFSYDNRSKPIYGTLNLLLRIRYHQQRKLF